MAAAISRSTWKDTGYSYSFTMRNLAKSSSIIGIITSAQVIGSLAVRFNIDLCRVGRLMCYFYKGSSYGSLLLGPVRSKGDSGTGSCFDARWRGITSDHINSRLIRCSTSAR